MSSDGTGATAEGGAGRVGRFIETGLGDRERLEYILRQISGNRPLRQSDQAYLESLDALLKQDDAEPPLSMPPDAPSMIDMLVRLERGDLGRLRNMKTMLEDGRPMYRSDEAYLMARYAEAISEMPPAADYSASQDDAAPPTETLPEPPGVAPPDPDQLRRQELLRVAGERKKREGVLSETRRNLDQQIQQEQSKLDAQLRLSEELSKKKLELDQIKTKLADANQRMDATRASLKDLERLKDQLSTSITIQDDLNANIFRERQEIRDLIEKQRESTSEQVSAAAEIRAERAELEQESARLAKAVDGTADEHKKLLEARKELRSLKVEERKLDKHRKDMEKVEKEIQKGREKLAKRIEAEKVKIEEQAALKRQLDKEAAELEEVKEQREVVKKETKLAQKVVRQAKARRTRSTASKTAAS